MNGSGVIYHYKDDGRGLDTKKIFNIAKAAGLTTKQDASQLTKNEVLGFLFNPAFELPKQNALDVSNLVQLKDLVVQKLHGKMRLSYLEEEEFTFQLLVPEKR